MARPWRLRHKLFLGLGLIVASVGLLLGGAMLGLSSYFDAGRVTEHKLNLMQVVAILRDHVQMIASDAPAGAIREDQTAHLLGSLAQIRQDIATYRTMRAETYHPSPTDPDDQEGERHYLAKMDSLVNQLEAAVRSPDPTASARGNPRLIDEPAVRKAYDLLSRESTELMLLIRGHITTAIDRAKSDHRRGMIIVSTATVIAVVLVLTMLYYFRVWVLTPIRQLQAGVQRVHRGDFSQPITLDGGDELQELAEEFNAMTARVAGTETDLARQVNDRSRQLVRSERMVSVGFLAAGVAHEINNPLASIAFCAEGMERRLHGGTAADDPAVIEQYLNVIQQEAFRCKQITQKLLDFSRSGERKRETADLGRLVQDVIDVTRVLPDHRGKTIQFTPAYLTAPVSAPDVKSVVLNMIVNGLESMDDGGTLVVSVAARGDFAELTFRDAGCGMTADVMENIFEPFFTRRRTGNGTGLGLSISHQIIDQHGGQISAASDGPGRGSTFVVRLPLREAAAAGSTGAVVLPFARPAAAA